MQSAYVHVYVRTYISKRQYASHFEKMQAVNVRTYQAMLTFEKMQAVDVRTYQAMLTFEKMQAVDVC